MAEERFQVYLTTVDINFTTSEIQYSNATLTTVGKWILQILRSKKRERERLQRDEDEQRRIASQRNTAVANAVLCRVRHVLGNPFFSTQPAADSRTGEAHIDLPPEIPRAASTVAVIPETWDEDRKLPWEVTHMYMMLLQCGGSVANSAGKVEGPETQEAKESVNGSRAEVGPDVASKLSSLFAGLPSLAGPQRLATTLRQRFANNSGKFTNVLGPRRVPLVVTVCTRVYGGSLRSLTKLRFPARQPSHRN
ncbi:hypothetical protein WN51_09257 [Melipona quadrifasciata]|uniref:Uncharacterized protein n=1 Tax=Melipona quadrifasciata TaxID=166423 RepID=A0A0M9A7N1_9HYME|nr:hypothetical protein WN51_09257 [Melipona quadrifasciata]